jgi:DNA invertase Pin-like site-specific DNA recombinase
MAKSGPKPKHDDRIRELRESGMTARAIGHTVGLSYSTVYSRLKHLGMAGKVRHGRAPQYDQRIVELRREGLSLDAIARQIGCSSKTVYDGLKRHGLTRSRRKKAAKPKRKAPASVDRAFTLVIIGERAGIKVLPTSEAQYERLLAMLQDAGGEVI